MAAEILGFTIAGFGGFPDNQLDRVAPLIIAQAIEQVKKKLQPEFVFTHFWGDLNIDHRRVFEAVPTALRPLPREKCRTIQPFEVTSASEWGSPAAAFRPTSYTEVSSADVEKAVLAYQAYAHEVHAEPHSRSVEAFLSFCVAAKPASSGRKLSYFAASSLHSHRRNHPLGKPPRSCAHHKHLKSTNLLERLNQEIKRRTLMVCIFPDEASCLRLVQALAVETHEEWVD